MRTRTSYFWKILSVIILLESVCLLCSSPGYCYDRAAAAAYARRWSNNWPLDGSAAALRNDAVYVEPSAEGCTSFSSQCLIAGGIRFRSSYHRGDNAATGVYLWRLMHGSMLPEINTGLFTYPVNASGPASNDMKNYSRILGAATHIYQSLISSTHVSVDSLPPFVNSPSQELLLTGFQLEPSDIYTVENGAADAMIHSGFISNIIYGTVNSLQVPVDLQVCGHNSERNNIALSNTSVPQWKTQTTVGSRVHVIHIPDAPLVITDRVSLKSGGNLIQWHWINEAQGTGSKKAGPTSLQISITFDCPMADVVPQVQLVTYSGFGFGLSEFGKPVIPSGSPSTTISFVADTASGYDGKGWLGYDPMNHRTWIGIIPADKIIKNFNGPALVTVSAASQVDGTFTDYNNELAEYEPGTPMSMINLELDTRGGAKK